MRKEENEETEFYCKAVEHANNRIDRALTKLDELTIDAEDFFCDEDFESRMRRFWALPVVKMPKKLLPGIIRKP